MADLASRTVAAREAAPAQLEPTFAEKVKAFRQARRALEKVYAVTDEQLKALGLPPPIPSELFVTFSHPEKQGKATPSEEGWTAEELRWIAKGNIPPGRPVWLHWLRPDDPIRKRAAELIPVREAHDARREDWMRKGRDIEAAELPYLTEADRAASAVLLHPVFTLAEVREKIKVAQEAYAFEHDDADDFRDAILSDVLAISGEDGRA